MIQLLLIFAPGLLSAVLHRKFKQKPMSNSDFLVCAVIYAFFITAFCFGIVYLRGFGDIAPIDVFSNLRSVAKYCTVAATTAVALPNMIYFAARLFQKEKRDEA